MSEVKTGGSCTSPWEAAGKKANIAAVKRLCLLASEMAVSPLPYQCKVQPLMGLTQRKVFALLGMLGRELEGAGNAPCLWW